MNHNIDAVIALSAVLFGLGVLGVLTRKNAITIFMSIELMLNSVNLSLVAFSRLHNDITGQMLVIFVMAIAAAEVAVGLAIVISIFRNRQTADVTEINLLRW
ncbi:MAG: NADH-quinone oxidoreductase subunit NuoK [Bacteroidetes bacterium]|nr:NADH-quinone oxidoreductase subunit NuoK [Bacteroidota bacterium]